MMDRSIFFCQGIPALAQEFFHTKEDVIREMMAGRDSVNS